MKINSQLMAAVMAYAEYLEKSYRLTNFTSKWYVEALPRKKYLKIITVGSGSRSSHSWIDEQGVIWKSASWNGPEKNFPRGSVFHPQRGGVWPGIDWTGATGKRWNPERNVYDEV